MYKLSTTTTLLCVAATRSSSVRSAMVTNQQVGLYEFDGGIKGYSGVVVGHPCLPRPTAWPSSMTWSYMTCMQRHLVPLAAGPGLEHLGAEESSQSTWHVCVCGGGSKDLRGACKQLATTVTSLTAGAWATFSAALI